MALSFSTTKDLSCPARYVKKHVEHRPEAAGEFARVGQIVADLMAEARYHWFSKLDYLGRESLTGIADQAKGLFNATDEEAERAVEIVYNALQNMDLLPNPETVEAHAIERGMAFDKDLKPLTFDQSTYYTGGWESAWFKCKPDFVWLDKDGALHVEDDKSGWNDADPEQLIRYAQAVILNLAAQGKPMPAAVYLTFNYLAQKRRQSVPFFTEGDEFPPDTLDTWICDWKVEETRAADNPIEIQGPHCDWCGFVDECGRHAAVRDQLATIDPEKFKGITTLEQAQSGAFWLMNAKRCVSAAEDKMREWVKANGPVEIPGAGMVLKLTSSEPARRATVADVLCILMGEGIDEATVANLVKIGPSDVEDVLKEVYPRAPGVTKQNMARRVEIMEALEPNWTKSPRAARLTITKGEVA